MLTRSVSHLAFGKDDVSCLDMPTRHTRTSRGTEASALLRCRGRDGKRLALGAEAACLAGALSRQIRDLEDEIGFSLLERTAKSLRLTDAGRAFLDTCVGGYAVEILRGTVVLCVAPPNAALKSLLVQLNCY